MVTDQIYFLNKQEKPAKDTEKKRSERQKEKLEGMISQMSKYQSNTFYIRDDPLLLKFKGNRIYVFTSSHSINSLLFFKFSRVTLYTSIPKLRAQVSVRKLDLNHS